MIETIVFILFVGAILFVALAAPKPADKKEKHTAPQQPTIEADQTNDGALSQPPKPADRSSSPPKSPDDPG